MAVIPLKTFGGISPRIPPRYLDNSQAQVAINCPVFAGSINPLPGIGAAVATLTKSGTPLTIYRFGQDNPTDAKYWFHWAADVDVCRGQIAGDTSEWTFYTGDGAPKATYGQIALSGTNYPAVSRPLGLPNPTQAVAVDTNVFVPATHPATLTLSSTQIKQLTTAHGIQISITGDTDGDYTTITLTSPITATSVAAAVDAFAGVNAAADTNAGSVTINSDAEGTDAKLYVRYYTGVISDTTGAFTYAGFDYQATGASNTSPYLVILDSEIGSIDVGDTITLGTRDDAAVNDVAVTSTHTAASFATFLNGHMAGQLVATAYGSSVVVSPGTQASGSSGHIYYHRAVDGQYVAELDSVGSESGSPAFTYLSQADVTTVQGKFIAVKVNNVESFVAVSETETIGGLNALSGYGVNVTSYGAIDPFVRVTTNATGSSATLRLRAGTFPTTTQYATQSSTGYSDVPEAKEARVYTWTWVVKEAGFEFESGPAPASASVDVRLKQTVNVSGRDVVPVGYNVTHWRIYRSVAGSSLYVTELPVAQTSFTDDVLAEGLGEVIPSLTWSPPPADLAGLINLPNGIMAGFVGRDVYFCDPYHPHAWPVGYSQSLDYPVVGLGRMDTTLAVLTTGVPYFIQGSHPDGMTAVKSDLEQACASKRSIVSMGGSVLFASPDGLVLLSSNGSKILTETMFTHAQWLSYFKPSSISGYHHDLKYIGFYDNGTTQGGFIYDLTSGQFILHSLYATAGYTDLQVDKLFLTSADRAVKAWMAGDALPYTWKSKKFSMPQIMGFSCAQLEAEAYPVTAKIYSDGVLVHTETVASRKPFRLPVSTGRDWEFQFEGSFEIFAFAVAQSMEELAGV